jgi:hypothetical protein
MVDEVIKSDGWDDPALVDAVKEALDELDAEPTPEAPEGEPAEDQDPEQEPAAEPAELTGDESPTPDEPEDEPAGDDDETPAVPDSHFRAAIHMGYTPEEISELYEANPDLALKTLAKCHETVNAASRQLGELGQAVRRAKQAPAATATPEAKSRKAETLAKLKERYEDDPIIDILGELIPDAPAPRQAPEPTPMEQPMGRTLDEEVAVRQQIEAFFADPNMEAYDEFYGKGELTPGQRANRIAMLDQAQLLLDGAEAAGMKMAATEAMEKAHLMVAAPIAEQIVREKIKAAVVKRAKGVTLKPSASKSPLPKGAKYDEEKHKQEVAAELKSIFG